MAKFMVSIGDENFRLLDLEARQRGISMQELIRAVIVPDWVRLSNLLRIRLDEHRVPSAQMVGTDGQVSPIYTQSRR
jgi:hypothetical protein